MFEPGHTVHFAGHPSVVVGIDEAGGTRRYRIENGPQRIEMWVPEAVLEQHQAPDAPAREFHARTPHLLAVDDFFRDPDEVRSIALVQDYAEDPRHYKGLRSTQRFLWPHLREEFARLLGRPVRTWMEHGANGCFQQTSVGDPLVWHHDDQDYAAAVYLTPDAPPSSGTSFWRDRAHHVRRQPSHEFERRRLGSDEAVRDAEGVVYDPYNLEHGENWELVESIAGLYNRLVIWDARLIHSATSYAHFSGDGVAPTRLVQLFFFDLG